MLADHWLHFGSLPNSAFPTMLLANIFFRPLESRFYSTLLRDKRAQQPFYTEPYQALTGIDRELAESACLCPSDALRRARGATTTAQSCRVLHA